MTKFIFITGGVVSSLGKGITSSSLGALLQARDYSVKLRKLDPYLNVDPGTMNPTQHGEVFVTDDGTETDLDLGHYERFTGVPATKFDNTTTGKIYSSVIAKERQGNYLGETVQVIPHITNAIKEFITQHTDEVDFVLIEVGGTVGDIESLPFLEAIRQLGNDLGPDNTLFIHLTLVPYIASAKELKTKPTQHSVKELLGLGIQPKILMCRCDRPIPVAERAKIAAFCNVCPEAVISALDARIIYEVPIQYHEQGLDLEVLKHFNLPIDRKIDLSKWYNIIHAIMFADKEVTIAIVGKYISYLDSYKSLSEALDHGGIANKTTVHIHWIDSEDPQLLQKISTANGILVPGGFGERGTEGKMAAITYARENNIPFFGICFGMQLAVIEAARNLAGLSNASSTEFGPCTDPVIGLLSEWNKDGTTEIRNECDNKGGTMRLGSYEIRLDYSSMINTIYENAYIFERHRHRYEVNPKYQNILESVGLRFSGTSLDWSLPESIEIQSHPWFIGVQFHPELKSKPFDPHPLFVSFIKSAIEQQ